jgi:hypothetical protein
MKDRIGNAAFFKNQMTQAEFGRVNGRSKPGGPASNNDDVEQFGHDAWK